MASGHGKFPTPLVVGFVSVIVSDMGNPLVLCIFIVSLLSDSLWLGKSPSPWYCNRFSSLRVTVDMVLPA